MSCQSPELNRSRSANPKLHACLGFTLLELLVVIAIITILTALLLSALSSAKAAAHSAQCKSNLKQFGLALNMYVNDIGVYPQCDGVHIWSEPLNTYLRQPPNSVTNGSPYGGVFLCPSDLQRRLSAGRWSYGYNAAGPTVIYSIGSSTKTGLGLGAHIPNPPDGTNNAFWSSHTKPTRETDVQVPSEMIAIADSFSGTSDKVSLVEGEKIIARTSHFPYPPRDDVRLAQMRHRGSLNVTFCDGHVEALKVHTLFFEVTDEAYKRWSRDNESHRRVPL